MPLISIITVTYNAATTLEKTIKSVISQSFTNFEFLIIDGNSTDDTMKIVSKYSSQIATIISEDDKGIYDAMNKGILAAKGKYLLFLGADDVLLDLNTLSNCNNDLSPDKYDLLVGNVIYDTGNKFMSNFGFKTLLNNTVHHQGAFYSKRLFKNFLYDISYRLIADYELNLFIYLNRKKYKYKFINETICICADGGESRKILNKAFDETNAIREKLLGKSPLLKWIYTLKFKLSYAI